MVQRVENKWSELLEDLRVIRPNLSSRIKNILAERTVGAKASAGPVDFSGSFPAGLMSQKIREIAENLGIDGSQVGTTEHIKGALAERIAEVKRAADARESSPIDFSGSFSPALMSEKIREIAEGLGLDASRVGTTEHIHRTAAANFPWTMGSDAAAERIKAYLEAVATEKLRRKSEG